MTTRRGLLGTLAGGVAGLSGCISNPLSGGSGSESTPNATAVTEPATTEPTDTPTATPTDTPTATSTDTPTATLEPVGPYPPSEIRAVVRTRLDGKRGQYGIDGLSQDERLQTLAKAAARRRGNGGSVDPVRDRLGAIGCDNGGVLVTSVPRDSPVSDPGGDGVITVDSAAAAAKYAVRKWTVPGESRYLVVDERLSHVGVGSYLTDQNVFVSAVLC